MKQFACGDVVPGCTSTFRESSDAEILAKVAKHAHEDHGLTDISADLVAAVKKNIHDVDAPGGV